jgi:hypothetical protein
VAFAGGFTLLPIAPAPGEVLLVLMRPRKVAAKSWWKIKMVFSLIDDKILFKKKWHRGEILHHPVGGRLPERRKK